MGHYEVAVNSSHLFPYDFIGKSNKLISLKNDPSSKVDYIDHAASSQVNNQT